MLFVSRCFSPSDFQMESLAGKENFPYYVVLFLEKAHLKLGCRNTRREGSFLWFHCLECEFSLYSISLWTPERGQLAQKAAHRVGRMDLEHESPIFKLWIFLSCFKFFACDFYLFIFMKSIGNSAEVSRILREPNCIKLGHSGATNTLKKYCVNCMLSVRPIWQRRQDSCL